jgi:hypothetical protein
MTSREELEAAFEHYQQTVRRAAATDDWTLFGGLFTEDADYTEHAYGRFSGRPAISAWAVRTMTAFPGNAMTGFPVSWSVFDTDRSRIVCEIQNVMPDAGDGQRRESPNITILTYSGDLLFSAEEDVYNPMNFVSMVVAWARVADEHGRLPADARPWLARHAARAG